MKRIKIIGKALLVAAFVASSAQVFASDSKINDLKHHAILLTVQGMTQDQKEKYLGYGRKKIELGKRQDMSPEQKNVQKEAINKQIIDLELQWLNNPPDSKEKKEIREMNKRITELELAKLKEQIERKKKEDPKGWIPWAIDKAKEFRNKPSDLKDMVSLISQFMVQKTFLYLTKENTDKMGLKGKLLNTLVGDAVSKVIDAALNQVTEKEVSPLAYAVNTGMILAIDEGINKYLSDDILKKFDFKIKGWNIPVSGLIRDLIKMNVKGTLNIVSRAVMAYGPKEMADSMKILNDYYHDISFSTHYYYKQMKNAAYELAKKAGHLLKPKPTISRPPKPGEQKIINGISRQLQGLQARLRQVSETLYKKNKPFYDISAVKNLKSPIRSLKNSIDKLPEKYDDLKKMVNLDEESAKAWKESLNNIVKIANKWYQLFADPTINFSKRTAPKERIDYYGNEWYNEMRKDIATYRQQLWDFENITNINKHYKLLQAMYTAMFSTRHTVEIGVLSQVYYVLGAYAGGIARWAVGTRAYAHPTFKIEPEKTVPQP